MLRRRAEARSASTPSRDVLELGAPTFPRLQPLRARPTQTLPPRPGTTYNYRVRAQDANNFYGPYSVAAAVSIPAYFDNAADGGNNGGSTTSLTYPYTVGTNSNRLLLVNLVGDSSADDISSVTYAGASMTLIRKVRTPGGKWHYLYYLLATGLWNKQRCHNGS